MFGHEIRKQETAEISLVLDIGTTTLALALVSLKERKIIDVRTSRNPQCMFGADVISRISYATANSSERLQKVLVREVNRMIEEIVPEQVSEPDLYVAGNTTMLHLLFGEECAALGVAPYTPVFLNAREEAAEKFGVRGIKTIYSLPCISAFVGADIVAGMHYAGMPPEGKYYMLLDLGTNAEIVLYSGERVICTSAAAGPCFEGAEISCGMSATEGAVSGFSLDSDGNAKVEVLGGGSALGLCGTGLIDVVAELLKNGMIDETGYMESDSFEVVEGVVLTQDDVRQFQLAKAAIYAAMLSLMKISGVLAEEVANVAVSGGFSAKLKIENAVYTGLLPEEWKEKCVAMDNTSLLGTVKYVLEQRELFFDIAKAEYVNLAETAEFSELFVRHMLFE